ncbi:MAG: asparagine synthase [Rubrivivax sp.]|nr:MAG: asparagine synthase [Rubrivivax sp.]
MFRYVAIVWNPSQPACAAAALQYGKHCRSWTGWDCALRSDGLDIHAVGTRIGANEVHRVNGGRGAVLGKVFARARVTQPPRADAGLSIREEVLLGESDASGLARDFWGRYVAFILGPDGCVEVFRDPSGALPCYRMCRDGVTLVFSWLEDVLLMLEASPGLTVNWAALTALLHTGRPAGRQTLLEGIHEVLPGDRVNLRTGHCVLAWRATDFAAAASVGSDLGDVRARPREAGALPAPDVLDPRGAREAADALAHTVRHCVRAWASCYDSLLLRLSGGVDSSIVLSCLDPQHAVAEVLAVNYHSAGADSDEREFARLMATRAQRPMLERERRPGFRLERVLAAARMPAPVPYIGWMNSDGDAQLSREHAAPAMFSGTGGDFVFYEYPRWWAAADYLHGHGLGREFAAVAMDAARLGRVSFWQATARAMREWIRPDLSLRATSGFTGLLAPGAWTPQESPSPEHPCWGALAELPIGKYMQTLAMLYPVGYYDPFSKEASPELVSPLLSQPVVELCLSLPTYLLTKGGRGRALARRAFADALPPRIANRRSKGGMEEHIKVVLDENIELVRELLLDGALCDRGLLHRSTLEALLSGRPTALAGTPTQLHGLAAIEAWLTHWA